MMITASLVGFVAAKHRVDDIRSGKVKMIPGEQVLREFAKEFPDEEQAVPHAKPRFRKGR
jgi:hypothetical protein